MSVVMRPGRERLQVKAVLFDLDNTLLDRTATFRLFTEKLLDRYGDGASANEREAMIEEIRIADEDGYKNKRELFTELLNSPSIKWSGRPGSAEELMAFYREHYVCSARLMETAAELLARCRPKYKLGLITNGRTAIQYGKIDRLSLRGSFDFIAVSEEAGVKKPDLRIFRLALDGLGVAPEEAVYIGDHPVNDMGGADAAGMRTIWLRRNQPWPESLKVVPYAAVDTLRELFDLL
ncbi:HAD family hydrolase [Paenibacillus humicola]|uniref:HAD family hydrolase n=1 Tax=Paenibacillus humicola TaxID=3110540 RepID=UPI00237A65F2|nr:HAD family hydrolase [Paenibacillus humicola]